MNVESSSTASSLPDNSTQYEKIQPDLSTILTEENQLLSDAFRDNNLEFINSLVKAEKHDFIEEVKFLIIHENYDRYESIVGRDDMWLFKLPIDFISDVGTELPEHNVPSEFTELWYRSNLPQKSHVYVLNHQMCNKLYILSIILSSIRKRIVYKMQLGLINTTLENYLFTIMHPVLYYMDHELPELYDVIYDMKYGKETRLNRISNFYPDLSLEKFNIYHRRYYQFYKLFTENSWNIPMFDTYFSPTELTHSISIQDFVDHIDVSLTQNLIDLFTIDMSQLKKQNILSRKAKNLEEYHTDLRIPWTKRDIENLHYLQTPVERPIIDIPDVTVKEGRRRSRKKSRGLT